MIESRAAEQLAALGHPARLRVLRTLMAAGPNGTRAGDLARSAELAANATSFHLNRLRLAGLAHRRRTGREVRYSADFPAVQVLLDFLGDACCAGVDESCGPICGSSPPVSAEDKAEANR
ncbi:MAG: metalloregulator ArsR/SmtB family transcription factor [Halofilum sp. (in: g-proteobacteria)]|nr:metalloregulator ArsR/SmtB family transcription factor [Halofilum sp. (in: g-proteobacteria)]